MALSSFTTETKLTRKGALILNKLLEAEKRSPIIKISKIKSKQEIIQIIKKYSKRGD